METFPHTFDSCYSVIEARQTHHYKTACNIVILNSVIHV